MGVDNYPEISQQKLNYSFFEFEFIRAYIYGILILTELDWTDNVQNLELTLNKPKEKGLKCNSEKYFFRQTKIEYLGFWVTHDGIKSINIKI